MRLSDMRPDDAPLAAEVEAELAALDAALAGDDVPAGMEGLEALVGDLRAERATPEAEFGDTLDAWAAAGFPRGRRPGLSERATDSDMGGRARMFLASITPRRLAYAGGAAATLVAIVIGVSQINWPETADDDDSADSGGAATELEQAEPATGTDQAVPDVVPTDGGGARLNEEAARSSVLKDDRVSGFSQGAQGPARGEEERKVERDIQMTLTAPSDEVQDVTNEAIGIVRSHRGIVEQSNSAVGDERSVATLQLVIPTRQLDSAIGQLSDLADVKSLNEGTLDITRPFLDAKDQLADLRAEREGIRNQLADAESQDEIDQLKQRLAIVNDQIAQANAEFENVKRRANLSSVTLVITSQGADEGDWSLEDALDDAGRVLEVGAGVALITAAIVLPLALILAIVYFLISAGRNRAREKALDE
jgi:Domain of unknown function (DUF4349)